MMKKTTTILCLVYLISFSSYALGSYQDIVVAEKFIWALGNDGMVSVFDKANCKKLDKAGFPL